MTARLCEVCGRVSVEPQAEGMGCCRGNNMSCYRIGFGRVNAELQHMKHELSITNARLSEEVEILRKLLKASLRTNVWASDDNSLT